MRSKSEKRTFGVLPLAIVIIVLTTGALFVGNNALWGMLQADTEAKAKSWGEYVVNRVPRLDRILDGSEPMEIAAAYLWGRSDTGTMQRFRIFDKNGYERIDSSQSDFRPLGDTSPATRNKIAARVLETDKTVFEFAELEVDGATTYTARTLLPLIKAGEKIGVLEVISDETTSWMSLQTQFRKVALEIAGLVLLAFLLPGILYLRRTGQLEFAANRLQHTADYDALTGTFNRAAFTGLLREQINATSAGGTMVAVHFIDLDRFKNVNDGLGHNVGDQVLSSTAQRLRRLLGTREQLARLGADEFAIMQPYHAQVPEAVDHLARDIAREMARPFYIDGAEIQMGASVGYACSPTHGTSVDDLMRAADIALAHAKETAGGGAVPFNPSMEAQRQHRQYIEARLRHALSHHQFEVHYQPLYGVDGEALRGFEALLRLKDDDGKPISPEIFIPIAEEIGLIGAIGQWVLTQSARTAREWPDDLVVSVNLSPIQFQSHDMPSVVKQVLKQTGLPARRLELEVTESVLITDTDKVLTALREIKALGVSVALDDFGTGYSSLGYLWSFPFDKLKVDKSFMTDLTVDGSKSREILATIVALGKVLDLKVTAEGVETKEQAEVLRSLDCDLVQGFLYGRPLDADALAALLSARVQSEAMERASQRLKRGGGKSSLAASLKSA